MGYVGGKAGDGVYQKIINQIPPHETYIEPFAGGAAIMRMIKPARSRIALDVDGYVVERWRVELPGVTVINDDAISFLMNYDWKGGEFVYCDPPYPFSVRKFNEKYLQA